MAPADSSLTIGPYRLGRELDLGGLGQYYEAEHLPTGKTCLCEVIHLPALDEVDPAVAEQLGANLPMRLQRALKFRHPHVRPFLEVAMEGCRVAAGFEAVPGRFLNEIIQEATESLIPYLPQLFLPVLVALEAAYAEGIAHGALTPNGIFLTLDGEVQVNGIGLAPVLRELQTALGGESALLGQAEYLPPEVANQNTGTGPEQDMYSLTTIISECLSTEGLASVPNLDEVSQEFSGGLVAAFAGNCSSELGQLIGKATDPIPFNRYRSYPEFRKALLSCSEFQGTEVAPHLLQLVAGDSSELTDSMVDIDEALAEVRKQSSSDGLESLSWDDFLQDDDAPKEAPVHLKNPPSENSFDWLDDEDEDEKKSKTTSSVNALKRLWTDGTEAYRKKEYQKCLDCMEALLEIDPNHESAKNYVSMAKDRLAPEKPKQAPVAPQQILEEPPPAGSVDLGKELFGDDDLAMKEAPSLEKKREESLDLGAGWNEEEWEQGGSEASPSLDSGVQSEADARFIDSAVEELDLPDFDLEEGKPASPKGPPEVESTRILKTFPQKPSTQPSSSLDDEVLSDSFTKPRSTRNTADFQFSFADEAGVSEEEPAPSGPDLGDFQRELEASLPPDEESVPPSRAETELDASPTLSGGESDFTFSLSQNWEEYIPSEEVASARKSAPKPFEDKGVPAPPQPSSAPQFEEDVDSGTPTRITSHHQHLEASHLSADFIPAKLKEKDLLLEKKPVFSAQLPSPKRAGKLATMTALAAVLVFFAIGVGMKLLGPEPPLPPPTPHKALSPQELKEGATFLEKGKRLFQSERYDDAKVALERARTLTSGSPEVLQLLVQVDQHLAKIQANPELKEKNYQIVDRFQQIDSFLSQRNFREVKRLTQEVLTLSPQNTVAHEIFSYSDEEVRKEEAIYAQNAHLQEWEQEAEKAMDALDWDKALEYLAKIRDAKPDDPTVKDLITKAEAGQETSRAVKFNKVFAEAKEAYNAQNYARAIELFRETLAINPHNSEAKNFLDIATARNSIMKNRGEGIEAFKAGRYQECIDKMTAVLERIPEDKEALQYKLWAEAALNY